MGSTGRRDQAQIVNPAGVWFALTVVVLIVAGLASIAIITYPHAGSPTGASDLGVPLRFSTMAAGLTCPADPAYSPDGSRIAVVGTLGSCAAPTAPHAAAIFDAQSGALLRLLPLNSLLRVPRDTTVSFFSLGWSPDGSHLALVYTAFDDPTRLTLDHVVDSGLLVLDAASAQSTVIRGDSGYFPALGGTAGGFPLWDLLGQPESPITPVLPGLAYSWNQNHVPAPLVPLHGPVSHLPIDAGPRYPVGNPDGGPDFTIWQPGILVGPALAPVPTDDGALFLTVIPTWSPDGARVTVLSVGVALARPSQGTLTQGTAARTPLPLPLPAVVAQAPGRDAALTALAQRIGTHGSALIAWNPPGTLLASITCHDGATASALVLSGTASGVVRGSVALPSSASACATEFDDAGAGAYPDQPVTLIWSPSGQRVLVCDRVSSTVSVWPVSASGATPNG